MSKTVPVKSAQTVFDIVEELVKLDGAGVSELASHLDKPTSTVHDYLQSLESSGYVLKEDTIYRPSTRFILMGERVKHQREVFEAAKPEVDNIAESTGHHAGLIIREEMDAVVLHIARSDDSLQLGGYPGTRIPLHSNGAGKSLLAQLPNERVDEIVDEKGLPKMADNTITSAERLHGELETIREQGYATEQDEHLNGVQAIATAIGTGENPYGSVFVYGATSRIDKDFDRETKQLLLRSVNVIEVNLNI